jgi:hypothetical protein
MTEKIIGGALYFVTFIDFLSRKILLYLLKNKWQVLEVFENSMPRLREKLTRI